MMIKSKKNVPKRNSAIKEILKEENVSTEQRNSYLDKRSQIITNSSAGGSPAKSIEMDIENVPEPPARKESRVRSRGGSNLPVQPVVEEFEDEEYAFGIRKLCEYIGTFSVAHLSPATRAEFVRLQLQGMQDPKKSRPVMLFISLSGIKVCDPEDDKIVLMAHALKRISYATCDPDFGQFAFLARNPKGPVGVQYCHVFLTAVKREAEEINAIVARAFKVAYASLRSKNQFYELVQELNREQEEYFKQLTEAAESGRRLRPEELLDKQPLTSPDRVRGFVVGQGRVWAKQEDGKIQHKQPHKITGGVEPTVNNQYRPISVAVTSPVAPSPSSSSGTPGTDADESSSNDHEEWSGSLPAEEATTIDGVSIGAVSTEGGGEEEAVITPTAPPMTPGEISGQQELVTKQTQRVRHLPPGPYYSIERADEWSVNSLTAPNTDALRIIPESDASGCHILLQDETAPPGLREKMASTELQRGSPGQILLQDGVAPPQYVYGGGQNGEDGEDGENYTWGFNSDDLNCDTYRDSEYSERDSFDYSRSYAILEQFINATVDSAGSIDEWMDPDLRLTPTEREAPCNMFDEDSLNGDSDTLNKKEDEDTLKLNNKDNNEEDDDTLKLKREESKPNNDNPPKMRPQPAPRKNIPGQRLSKVDDENRDSANTDNQSDELDDKMRPLPAPRQLKSGQKSPTSPHSSHSSLMDSATQTSLKNGELVQPKQLALNGQLPPEPVVPERPNSMKGLNSPVSGQKVDNTQKLTSPRAPGHTGHKVEIEIGQFRCKRSPSHGAAPPLPPRSTSLHGDNRSSIPVMKDIEQATWFKAAIPREIAVEILQQEEKGAFIVRESKSHPGCFALSMKVDKDFNESQIANYLVVRTKNGGYTIKGFGRDFPDLPRLIHHYSLQREQLPCCLVLSRRNPLYEQEEEEAGEDYTGDDEEDLDYMSLTDFHSVMDGMS